MVEVTGTIGSCADQNAVVGAMQTEHPDDIIMVAGYCHTSLETYIEPVTVRVMSRAAIPRLLEAEVALDHRELLDAPGNLPSLVPHVAAARAMVAALADNDEVAFRRLARPEVQHEVDALEGKPLADWLRRDIREIHAQFASGGALRRQFAAIYSLGARQERVLVSRGDLQVVKTNGGAPSPVITCWCKTADCSGRWPVAAPDADNDPQRPYICARTNDYLLGPREGIAVQVDVEAEPGGFAEPAWPRPARHTG